MHGCDPTPFHFGDRSTCVTVRLDIPRKLCLKYTSTSPIIKNNHERQTRRGAARNIEKTKTPSILLFMWVSKNSPLETPVGALHATPNFIHDQESKNTSIEVFSVILRRRRDCEVNKVNGAHRVTRSTLWARTRAQKNTPFQLGVFFTSY